MLLRVYFWIKYSLESHSVIMMKCMDHMKEKKKKKKKKIYIYIYKKT